jgi:hypothetical protein
MEIEKQDLVTIDGKTARVVSWWGQGRHRVFSLDDGRTVFDLHLLVDSGDAIISRKGYEAFKAKDPESLSDLHFDIE